MVQTGPEHGYRNMTKSSPQMRLNNLLESLIHMIDDCMQKPKHILRTLRSSEIDYSGITPANLKLTINQLSFIGSRPQAFDRPKNSAPTLPSSPRKDYSKTRFFRSVNEAELETQSLQKIFFMTYPSRKKVQHASRGHLA